MTRGSYPTSTTRQAVHLLGGMQRVRIRVRGFAPWSPEKATLALLDQVQGVLDSTTDRHNFAAALAGHDRPTEVLHIGDHDPSGVSMFLAFLEDVEAFTRELGGSATFTRLAVTPQQIGEYRLPTAPPKATDRI